MVEEGGTLREENRGRLREEEEEKVEGLSTGTGGGGMFRMLVAVGEG